MEVYPMRRILILSLCLALLCVGAVAESLRVEFGNTFSLERPADLEVLELGEEEISEGMVYAAMNETLEMYVWALEMDGQTADELYADWQEDDYLSDVTVSTMGDTSYLTYSIEGEGLGAVVACDDGMYYDFIFYCEDDLAMEAARAILDSISPL